MALAPLGFVVDTSPVAKAVADLDKLTGATAKAQAGTKSITAPTSAAANATKQLGAAASQAATQMTLATNAVKANNAALQITTQSAAAAQMQMRNLSFQFQDIGTMLLAGQSPFMLLAQQLPQVTMYGGQLTGVMGALKNTFTSMISPLGLLTTGFVLAGSAAISYFRDADYEADAVAERLKEQEDLIQRVADRWGDAVPALREYAEEVKRVADLAELDKGTREAITRQFEATQGALDQVRVAIGDVINEMTAMTENALGLAEVQALFVDLEKATRDLVSAQQEGKDATAQLERVGRILASILENDVVEASDKATAAVEAYRNALLGASNASALLAGQRDTLLERGGIPINTAGRGDPRDFEDDPYWRSRYLPDPERPMRQRRPRRSEAEREAERARKAYADLIRSSEQYIAMQELEQRALFMTEEAANALRYEQEMLNAAANANIKLTPEMKRELEGLAQQMASAEAETSRLREALDFAKDVTKGFFSDLRSGLEQGKGFWESFANAATRALDRIVDKLLNDVIDAIFQVNSAGGGGGGLLGMLGGMFGMQMFPGGMGFATPGYTPWAKGGAFYHGNVIPFAKGGIVHGPTVFPFAKGIGLMGEAGPEAIMPLHRGPDGSLGVKAANQNHANQNIRVEVEVFVNDDGTLGAIARQAGGEAAQVTVKQGLAAYDKSRQKRYQAGGQFG